MADLVGGWFGIKLSEKPGAAQTDTGATSTGPGGAAPGTSDAEAVHDQQAKLDALEVRSVANPSIVAQRFSHAQQDGRCGNENSTVARMQPFRRAS